MLTPDFDIYYHWVKMFLNGRIPLLFFEGGYGPSYYVLLFGSAVLSGGDYFFIKFFFVFLDYLNLIMIYFICKQLNVQSFHKISIIYTLLPLSIIEFAWNGHNDTGMILFILISVYLLLKGKDFFSSIFLLLAIVYKFYAVFIFPLYIIYYYKKAEGRFDFFKKMFIIFIPLVAVGGFILLYKPRMISLFLDLIMSSILRPPTNGVLKTLNFSYYIEGLAGLLATVASNLDPLFPLLFLNIADIYSFAKITDISWLLFGILAVITFRKQLQLKNPVYLIFSAYPVIMYFIMLFLNFKIPLPIQQYINLGIVLSLIVYLYFYIYLFQSFNREDLILSILFILLMFISIYWVNYAWYFLWIVPFILIFYDKIRESRFIIIYISMYSFTITLQRFRNLNFIEFSILFIIISLFLDIILYIKISEYNAYINNIDEDFSKFNNKLPQFLNFDTNTLFSDVKQYKHVLLIVSLLTIMNTIILSLFLIFLMPKMTLMGPILEIFQLLPSYP